MSTTTIIATALAAGVLGTGAAVTPFATGADDPGESGRSGMHMWSGDSTRQGPGAHMDRDMDRYMDRYMDRHMDRGEMGRHMGAGMGPWAEQGEHRQMRDRDDCDRYLAGTTAELTPAQARTLADLAQEEKLSHDLYVALGESSQVPRFDRIASSEARHLAALRTLMNRHEVDDPTAGLDPGKFASSDVAELYRSYLDRGTASPEDALAVAREVERKDVADLKAAAEHVDAPDLERVYEHLAEASQVHLEAFGG